MFINCRFSTSNKDIDISQKITDLQRVLNSKGYTICGKVFKDTEYMSNVTDNLFIMESDTLASLAIIFMENTSSLCVDEDFKHVSIFSALLDITARTKRAFTVCVEEDDVGSLICLCRDIVRNSPYFDRVRIVSDPEDLDSLEEFGGVEIVYKK